MVGCIPGGRDRMGERGWAWEGFILSQHLIPLPDGPHLDAATALGAELINTALGRAGVRVRHLSQRTLHLPHACVAWGG